MKILADLPYPVKEYSSFDEFYPFYNSQHQDNTCRLLHFIGTSLLFLQLLIAPRMIPCLITSIIVGLLVGKATAHIEHGLFEMLAMIATFIILSYRSLGKWSSPVLCLTIGYGFAWVGHFFFELNRPATFTYPALSIMGDLKLWYEIAKYGLSLLVPTPHTS